MSCQSVWGCLRSLHQFGENFKDAEKLTIKDLAFWNKATDAAMHAILAKGMAGQLDGMLCDILGANYQPEKSNIDAINDIGAVFTDPDKSLPDLAEAVDTIYAF